MLYGSGDDLMNYAIFGAIGDLLGGGSIEDAIHGQSSAVTGPYQNALDRLWNEYDRDRERWSSGFANLESQFRDLSASARASLTESHAAELGYLQTGREDALQQLRQAGERRKGQTLGRNIQSGLAHTTFGQGMLGAIDTQVGESSAQLEAAYNERLAQTTARQGAELSGFDQWSATGLTELGRMNIAGQSALSQSWMGQIMGAEGTLAGYRQNFGNQIIGNEQNNMSMGQNIVGGILGGLGF
tara:strand:- start:801 stop:1529 length:729 start_codon:yes stop_codon:yes gene_type:complete